MSKILFHYNVSWNMYSTIHVKVDFCSMSMQLSWNNPNLRMGAAHLWSHFRGFGCTCCTHSDVIPALKNLTNKELRFDWVRCFNINAWKLLSIETYSFLIITFKMEITSTPVPWQKNSSCTFPSFLAAFTTGDLLCKLGWRWRRNYLLDRQLRPI